ncbi:MAG: chemotaxis protein CheX [Syntrophales bacterium]
MDVKLINPFLNGAKEVLRKMASVESTFGTPYIKQDDRATGDVSGVIGLTGDAIGSLAISFSESCICGIAGAMLGESFAQANQDVFDAVGEITNMISGVARTYLEKSAMTVWAGIPAVVFGKDHYVKHVLKSPSIVIPFTTEYGSFFVDVCIKSTLNKKASQALDQTAAKPDSSMLNGAPPPMEVIAQPQTATPEMTSDERIEWLKKELEETKQVRASLEKLLLEKPFMNIQIRQKYKKAIPGYDAKIKRLRLDITAAEMLRDVPVDDKKATSLPRHYQNYPAQKPPRERS